MEKDEKRKINWSKVGVAIVAIVAFAIVVALIFLGFATPISVFDTNGRVAADQVVLREMNDTLHEVNSKLDSMPQVGVHDSAEPAESSTPAEEVPSYTQEELISMAISDDFSNMMEVALYPEATESQLLFIATACAYSNSVGDETSAVRLATALLDHPNATSAVASTLAQTESRLVWLLVAQSELSSESTLAVLADHCINASFGISNNDPLVSVVSAICENDAVTEDVLNMFEHTGHSYIKFIVDTKLGKFPEP